MQSEGASATQITMKNKDIAYAGLDNLTKALTDEYRIPVSHAYAWEEKNWQRIWDEIIQVHELRDASKQCYLGVLTLNKQDDTSNSGEWDIIDGGNAMITLVILIKALYDKDHSNRGLEYLLCRKDIIKGSYAIPKAPAINLQVNAEKEEMQRILFGENGVKFSDKDKLCQGHLYFQHLIDERMQSQEDPLTDITSLAATLLNKVVFLVTKYAIHDRAMNLLDTSATQSPPIVAKQLFNLGIGRFSEEHNGEIIMSGRDLLDQGIYLRTILVVMQPKHLMRNLWRGLMRLVLAPFKKATHK